MYEKIFGKSGAAGVDVGDDEGEVHQDYAETFFAK